MNGEATLNLVKEFKRLKERHEEVSRALAADQTRVEVLDNILLELRKSIDNTLEKKNNLLIELDVAVEKKIGADQEKKESLNELRKVSSRLEEMKKETSELLDKKMGICDEMNKKIKEANEVLRGIEEVKSLREQKIKKELESNIMEIEEKEIKKKELSDLIDSMNKRKDNLMIIMEIKHNEYNEIKRKKADLDEELIRQKEIQKETKIMKQKLLEEQIKLKELRRNKNKE